MIQITAQQASIKMFTRRPCGEQILSRGQKELSNKMTEKCQQKVIKIVSSRGPSRMLTETIIEGDSWESPMQPISQ